MVRLRLKIKSYSVNEENPQDTKHCDLIFKLPEYLLAERGFTYKAIETIARASDPVISQLQVEENVERTSTQYSLPSGETLEMQEIVVGTDATLNFIDVLDGNLSGYYTLVYEMSQELIRKFVPKFYEHVATVIDAYGGTVNADGQPLSHELMLELFERKQISFDEEGNISKDEILVVGPQMAEELRQLPPRTPEQERKWNEMLERKRQEFNAGKRTRRIS